MITNLYYKCTLSNFKFINNKFTDKNISILFFFNVRWSKIRLVYFIHIPLIEYPKTERLKSISNQKAWPTCHRWKRNDTWLISTDFNTSVKRFTCSTVIFLPTSPHRSSILKAFLYSLQQRQPRMEFFRATRILYEIWCSAEKSKFFTVIQFNIEGNCVSPTLWETLVHTCGNVSQFYGKCNIRNKLFPKSWKKISILFYGCK